MNNINIDFFSHHFVVTNYDPVSEKIIRDFCRNFMQFAMIRVGYRWQRVPVKTYACFCSVEREYRFHLNQWNEFKKHCSNFGIYEEKLTIKHHATKRGVDVGLVVTTDKQPRDYQVPILEYLTDLTESRSKLVGIQTGKGKGQPASSNIKVPGGWTTMGDVQPGDIITGKNGKPTKVLGKFPQGIKDVYRITFADGRSTLCDDAHLWDVYYVNTSPHKRWRTVNTLEVMRLLNMSNPRVYIPLCDAEDCGNLEDLPIDPYMLGLLIGNGGFTTGVIKYSTVDKETIDYIASVLPEGVTIKHVGNYDYSISGDGSLDCNPVLTALKSIGLYGKKSEEKFIPEQYFNSSKDQRWSLLQGLMDTDGTVNTIAIWGAISYSTSSERLAKDVQFLVRSLGGIASISSRQTTYTYKGEKKLGLPTFDVKIRMKTPESLFRISRKKERTNNANQYAQILKLRVKSVEKVESQETFCIMVDACDMLYVTDDFIVTHNTFVACKAIADEGRRFAIVLKPKYIDKWISDIKELTNCTDDDILVIRGSGMLMSAIEAGTNGELKYKAIIISNKTLQNFISLYEEKGDEILNQGYDCCPQDLFEVLGADTRLIDEVHEDFHLNFKVDLYTHVHRSISLSATLISEDNFIANMYELAYPLELRYDKMEYDKYIHSIALHFNIYNAERLNVIGPNGMYTHHNVEKYILKNNTLRLDYFHLIRDQYEEYFVKRFKPGQRAIIFCASVDMCTSLTMWMQSQYPNIDINRYVEDDPYENLVESRTSITTIQSGGTGHDIKGLTFALLTNSIASSKSNIQGFGRLRKIDGVDLHFMYLVCDNIAKQVAYHEQKEKLLLARTVSHKNIFTNITLGRKK